MSFYAGLQNTAARLLEQFGQTVFLNRFSGGEIDPVTGQDTTTTETLTTVGVLRRLPDELIDGTRIKTTDRELVLTPQGELLQNVEWGSEVINWDVEQLVYGSIPVDVDPEKANKVIVNGEEFTIEEVQTSSPAGLPLVYFVRVRR